MCPDNKNPEQLKTLKEDPDPQNPEHIDHLKTTLTGVPNAEAWEEIARRAKQEHQQEKATAQQQNAMNLKHFLEHTRPEYKQKGLMGYETGQAILTAIVLFLSEHSKLMRHAFDHQFGITDKKFAASCVIKKGLHELKNKFSNDRENLESGIIHTSKLVQLDDEDKFQYNLLPKAGVPVDKEANMQFNHTIMAWLKTHDYELEMDSARMPTEKLINSSHEILTREAFKALRDDPDTGLTSYLKQELEKEPPQPAPGL